MWLALWGVLALLLFGSKVLSLGLELVLFTIHKVGLLSRIRVDEYTTLQLTLRSVRVSLWRNVWKCMHAPSQAPLVSIEIPSVHIVLHTSRRNQNTKTAARNPAIDVDRWKVLATRQSFKRLDHPMWTSVCLWLHRLPFMCLLLPLVGVTVNDISVDVVDDDVSGHTSAVRVQRASLALRFSYDVHVGEIKLMLLLCPDELATVTVHALGVEAQLRGLQLTVSAPISRAATDLRAPLPSSISIVCEKLKGSIHFATLLAEITRSTNDPLHKTARCQDGSPVFDRDLLKELLTIQRVLPIRLLQIVPDVHVTCRDVCIAVDNGATSRFDIKLDALEGHLKDAPHSGCNDSMQKQEEEARKLVLELVNLTISSGSALASSRSSSVRVDSVTAEVDTRLAIISSSFASLDATASTCEHLSWSTRVTGEIRGVVIRVADDLAPLVAQVVSATDQGDKEDRVLRSHQTIEDGAGRDDTWGEMLSTEMQVQLKVLRTEIVCAARSTKCAVLPNGVPDIGLCIDEIVVFANPFINQEPLGIRAKADLQALRLKLFYVQSDRIRRTPFLSMDFVRVFIEPIGLLRQEVVPAPVVMEAEWLEVRWTPEAMHSLGGLLELGIVVLAPLMQEFDDWTSDDHWDPHAARGVKPMKQMSEVTHDRVSASEAVKFRCTVKRALVMFSHTHAGRCHVDFVTVDALRMSVEETTGRFRLSACDISVSHADRVPDLRASSATTQCQQRHRAMRRRPSSLSISVGSGNEARPLGVDKSLPVDEDLTGNRPFFSVQIFALEENKLPACPFTVLDMFVDGVSCAWSMDTQARIVELIRRITFSSWEMLYRMRSAYGVCCTPPTSRYNRVRGKNAAMEDADECARAERLLQKLISASGDALNRIRATNIDLHTEFRDGARSFDVKLHVGVFASDDLPELWRFEDVLVSINDSLTLLAVDQVQVRHTVERRRDYVFGFFEEALRLRQIACSKLPSDSPRKDGLLIDIEGLRVSLSLQLDLFELGATIHAQVAPYLATHMASLASWWRPQQEVFYLYFLQMPNTQGQPNVWLQLSKIQIECVDKPLEAWLEHVYPLWIEELAEQELRSQLLEEQVTALKLTNADMLVSDAAADEMKELLYEKSSKVYAHKIKRLRANAASNGVASTWLQRGAMVTVHIGLVALDASFEACEQTTTTRIRELDEATASIDRILRSLGLDPASQQPQYAMLLHQNLTVSVLDISLQMRKFVTPIAVVQQVKLHGSVIVAAHETPQDAIDAFAFTGALRCFVDLHVTVERPVAFFGPAYLSTMQELASIAERVTPYVVLDVDSVHSTAPWDMARRLVHGKLRLQVQDLTLRLLACDNSFQKGDYLEVAVQQVDVTCGRGEALSTHLSVDRLTVKIEPDALVNIGEIANVALQLTIDWSSTHDASMHYFLPVEFRPRHSLLALSSSTIIDFTTSSVWRRSSHRLDVATRLERYAGAALSISVSGKIAPRTTTSETMSRREIASRSAIVLYTKHVEWLIRFARIYQRLPQHKWPRRRHPRLGRVGKSPHSSKAPSRLDTFLCVFKRAVVDEFSVVGLDVALYHSEKSPVGIRACINDKIALSGSFASAATSSGRLVPTKPSQSLPVALNGFHFVVDDVALAVSDIQVRICTPKTGSRGDSLVSIRDVCLYVGGTSPSTPVASRAMPDLDFATIHSAFQYASASSSASASASASRHSSHGKTSTASFPLLSMSDVSRTKSKKTILEHFAIQQHNPYCFRDDDSDAASASSCRVDAAPPVDGSRAVQLDFVDEFRQQGFVLGLVASEIRVLVTMDTIETLVDIVENWVRVVRSSLPELDRVPEELLRQPASPEQTANQAFDLDSPKKATSLADDPRFGAIFHASNLLPKNRTPSFHAEPCHANATPVSPTTLSNAGASVVEPFLTVRFMDCQINVQDHHNKGSVLLALSCGSLRHSRSHDVNHELLDLKVDGVQLFTAPLDIDVRSRIIWLLTLSDGITYCPSSYGLLKQVVAPIPTQVMVWIDRDLSVMNRVDLRIPTVDIAVTIDSKIILQNVVLAVIAVVNAKLAEHTALDYSKMLQGFRSGADSTSVGTSLQQLVHAKRDLQWRIAELHWRNACRWNYQATERASMAMLAMQNVRAYSLLDLDASESPFLQPRRLSSTSLLSSMGTSLSLTGSAATHVEPAFDELQRLQQQCDSISDIVRSLVATELLKRQLNPNVQLTFTLHKASLTLSGANADIVSATMADLKVHVKMFDDQAGTFALTLHDVSCTNLSPNTPYPELLQALQGSQSWSGDDMFLRVDADVAPPVGGIQVVRHFEVNVHPMQVCLSYDLILQLVAFFTSVSAPTQRQEEQKAEIRSQFLAAPQPSSGVSSDGLLKKAAKVAGKAAHPLTHGLSRHRADGDSSDRAADPRVKARPAHHEEANQWITRLVHAASDRAAFPPGDEDAAAEKDVVNEMRDRAKHNIVFKRVRLGTVEVMVSFKSKKSHAASTAAAAAAALPLEDMRGFEVKIHSLVYCDKTCSLADLLLRIRRDILLDVLSQVGRNFTNVATFLRDQLDPITRWGAFDALAPLKSLSTAITGGSAHTHHTSVAPVAGATCSHPLSPRMRLSLDELQQSAGAVVVPHPTTPVDSSKVFQLELPDSHPSRKNKTPSHARASEPALPLQAVVATAVRASAMGSPQNDKKDSTSDTASSRSAMSHHKPKRMLSSLFSGKKNKAMLSPTTLPTVATPLASATSTGDDADASSYTCSERR